MTDSLASSILHITGTALPRGDFFELVKAIGEAKSKQEEDRIIMDEMAVLKQKMPSQATFTKKMKEYLVRLIYCEMLGHDASFGYIKAVELSASSNLLQKRVGYLTASLCLAPDHEFRFMLVNQFTRDMSSINYLEVCAALNAVCRLTTVDTIPAVINEVTNKLKHEQEAVRKKAVMALQKFHSLQPSSISHLDDRIRRALCDKDPSVMAAVLCLLLDLIKENPQPYKDLVPSFVSILKQIIDHRLPRDYDYHRIPAPWVQIHLLRILAILGNSDQRTSEGMYEILVDVMRRADTGINVGYAIVYECVRTVTTIYPNTVLLDAAASSIARFIGSDNHNLKYLGVKGLAAIVKDHPRYAGQHQLAVIDCLEDPDETLKRKTLDLLHRMTNPVNVEFITAKLLEFLEKATDVFLRTDLVQRISQSSERYAPSTSWYIQTMTRVFLLAGELVKTEVAHTLMQLIAEGAGEDEEVDIQLRKDAVENYINLLDKDVLPDILVQTMSWVLGEYGYLSQAISQAELIIKLTKIAHRTFHDSCTRAFIITGIIKLIAQTGTCPPQVTSLIELYGESINLDLQQRCYEYSALLQNPSVMVTVLPIDASCEDLAVDESLSFLDSFVHEAISRGASRYCPPSEHDEEASFLSERKEQSPLLKLTPYAKPEKPMPAPPTIPSTIASGPNLLAGLNLSPAPLSLSAGGITPSAVPRSALGLRPMAQVWSRQGAAIAANVPGSKPFQGSGGEFLGQTQATQAFTRVEPNSGFPTTTTSTELSNEEKTSPAPRQLTEKEKMAQALFGGLTAGGSTGFGAAPVSGVARNGATTTAAKLGAKLTPGGTRSSGGQQSAPPPKVETATVPVDFLGLDRDDTPPSSTPITSASKPLPQQPSDLLGFDTIPPNSSSTKKQTTPPRPTMPTESPSQSGYSSPDPFAVLEEVKATSQSPHRNHALGLNASPPKMGRGSSAGDASNGILSTFSFNGRSLQPLAINTQEFGVQWTQMRFQAPAQIAQTTIRDLTLLATTLTTNVSFHIVESIPRTSEVIAAGRLGPDGDAILVHTKLHSQRGAADCLIKCNDNTLAQHIALNELADLFTEILCKKQFRW